MIMPWSGRLCFISHIYWHCAISCPQVLSFVFSCSCLPQYLANVICYYAVPQEYEARVEGVKPGVLSDELRKALGMTDDSPPPWLINMQRYGPPPSYPNLRAPGLNAPIPPGAQFGYHPGGWGKPPVDEAGNPLYGDVFGQHVGEAESDDEVDKKSRWGEMEVVEEESEEEESEEEQEEEDGGCTNCCRVVSCWQ